MKDDLDKIIKEQIYKFERLIRFCLFDYKEECKRFDQHLTVVCATAHVASKEELRQLVILPEVLSGELRRNDLVEQLNQNPFYIKELLQKHHVLPQSCVIFPQNRIKAYKLENHPNKCKIVAEAIRYIKNREEMVNRSVKINPYLLCVDSVSQFSHKLFIGNQRVKGNYLMGLDVNYLVDCPYSLESVKYLVKQND